VTNEIINFKFVDLPSYYIFTNSFFLKGTLFYFIRGSNNGIEEVDISIITLFLEEIKDDYLNFSLQFRTSLNKFVK